MQGKFAELGSSSFTRACNPLCLKSTAKYTWSLSSELTCDASFFCFRTALVPLADTFRRKLRALLTGETVNAVPLLAPAATGNTRVITDLFTSFA